MHPPGLHRVLVHGWEFAFKLHRPHSLMPCTWGTEWAEMSSRAMTYYYCTSQTNKRQVKSTTISIKICICSWSYFLLMYFLFAKVWAITWAYVIIWTTAIVRVRFHLYINNSRASIRYRVSPLTNTGVPAVLYDRVGQTLRRTCTIPLKGVSLTLIDQTDLLALPLPTFAVVEWF